MQVMWRNQSRQIDRDEEATWQRVGPLIARAISTVDLHLKSIDTRGLIGVHQSFQFRPLIARVITVEIKQMENAS